MEVLGCLGCPKPNNWQRGDVCRGWSSDAWIGHCDPCGEMWAEQPLGMKPPFLTTHCDPVNRAAITAVLFILNLPKLAWILHFLCFGWSVCCPRNQVSPEARIKNKLLSKQQISPSSQIHLPVYMMKKESYTYVLAQSVHTTLRLPADLQTYLQETLQGSKSLGAAEGLNRNVSPFLLSALSVWKEEQLSLPPAWDINKNLDSGQKSASISWSRLLLAHPSVQNWPSTTSGGLQPSGKGFAGQGSLPAEARGDMGGKAKGRLGWQGTTGGQVTAWAPARTLLSPCSALSLWVSGLLCFAVLFVLFLQHHHLLSSRSKIYCAAQVVNANVSHLQEQK